MSDTIWAGYSVPNRLVIETGQRFGRWTVLDPGRYLGADGWRARVRASECRCECGTVKVVRQSTLINGTSLSCGCLHSEASAARGRVPENTAAMRAAATGPTQEHMAASSARFRSPGHRALVAAAATTHGLSTHQLYGTWHLMLRRCENPAVKDYPNYGGRGITVCAEWHDVTTFITWIEANLGARPTGMTLDRLNPDGNYEPGNVRWASAATQAANRRRRA